MRDDLSPAENEGEVQKRGLGLWLFLFVDAAKIMDGTEKFFVVIAENARCGEHGNGKKDNPKEKDSEGYGEDVYCHSGILIYDE